MKEKPILFSGPMVRAILNGSKTQTRRIVKPVRGYEYSSILKYGMPHTADSWAVWWHSGETDRVGCYQECPYGKPGDRLWVRESAYIAPENFGDLDLANCVDGNGCRRIVGYSASMDGDSERCARDYGVKQSPSIFMPRWASRITLEITGVHAERLQGISEADASAEGAVTEDDVNRIDTDILPTARKLRLPYEDDRVWFAHLWDEINGKRASWESNPWVWVLKFQKVSG